jgi:hypothetical protein
MGSEEDESIRSDTKPSLTEMPDQFNIICREFSAVVMK